MCDNRKDSHRSYDMAPLNIPTPTVKTLQALLGRIGSATSGSKDVLVRRLQHELKSRPGPFANRLEKSTKILSIDMGIKNLALCVAEVKLNHKPHKPDAKAKIEMNVSAWRRLDVAKELSKYELPSNTMGSDGGEDITEDAYCPSNLARMAHTLVTQTLLPYQPDVILIERQRWRSGGGAAIQQWTVRVNTLEGMLWALFTAFGGRSREKNSISHLKDHKFDMFEIDPKRVGHFWIGDDAQATISKIQTTLADGDDTASNDAGTRKGSKVPRSKIEKKAKIDLVRSWLTSGRLDCAAISSSRTVDGEPVARTPNLEFSFSKEAEATKQMLCAVKPSKARKNKPADGEQESTKVDDVADCFLQATAFIAWEHNRSIVQGEWKGRW